MSFLIRKGTGPDVPAALELVKELARYENAPGEVEVTWKEMLQWFNEKLFDFFVLEQQGIVIGVALYYFKYSTWKGKCLFLEDLIITESERKKGAGQLLFDEIVKVAKQERVKRMEWQVLEWNEPAILFYKKNNTNFDDEWVNCKLTFDELQAYNFKKTEEDI